MIDYDLDENQILARLDDVKAKAGFGPPSPHDDYEPADDTEYADIPLANTDRQWRYVRPLADTANTWIDWLQSDEERWMLGLREIDVMTRGFGKGELTYVVGFAHSGKTQIVLNSMLANRTKPSMLVTLDEPAELVLAKLVGMHLRRNGEQLEAAIKANDPATVSLVRDVANRELRNILVVDQPVSLAQMTDAVNEARDYFGRDLGMVAIDFLELLRCEETDVEKKSQELKRWTKGIDLPVVCLHQGSRGNAGKGQMLTMQSMKYGGEAEATFVVGVRRKRDDPEQGIVDQSLLWNSVSVSVIKNKRPPSKKGEQDYYLDPSCGLIEPMGSVSQPKRPTVEEMARGRA